MNNGFQILSPKKAITVAIVNLPNALMSSIIGIQDVFHIANTFCIPDEFRVFSIKFLHDEVETKNFQSTIQLESIKIDLEQNFDVIIIPPIIENTNRITVSDTLNTWLNHMYLRGSYICSVCVGAYILASVGLLDNKKSTSHWIIEKDIIDKFPLVCLDVDKIIIEDQNIITSGGVSAYLDLSLYLIRKYFSISVAYQCANYLVVDAGRTSQKHYKNLAKVNTELDLEMKDLLVWIDANIQYPLNISALANKLHVSERTLIRRFSKNIGVLPTKYLQNIRVQKAKELIINSTKSFEQVTYCVGYEDISSFRRLFKQMTGLSPGEYKKLFMVK